MNRLNGVMEDLGAELGYTAASTLAAWFAGICLYVPAKAEEKHPIAKVIGFSAYKRLVAEYGGENICLPDGWREVTDRRDREIALLLARGHTTEQVAKITGLTRRRIQQIRTHLEDTGIVALLVNEAYRG
jgi:hypothetical protein